MKFFKKIIEWKLRILAGLVLKKYKPTVIGITGSVGKTSTKEAITAVFKSHFKTRGNIKNYNNEIGVPLSILGTESGKKNILVWGWIIFKGLCLLLFRDKNYPSVLVLEMGADRPGDIKYLTNFVKCKIGVVTSIAPAHLEFFGSLEKIAREKEKIVTHLTKEGTAILNRDDKMVWPMKEKVKAHVLGFGFDLEAELKASDLIVLGDDLTTHDRDEMISGINFKLNFKGNVVPVFLPNVLGKHQVYPALAAAAVGLALGLNLVEIAENLKEYVSPAGRMKLLDGIKQTIIIDDSYNASPTATIAALDFINDLKIAGEKFLALGDMEELGVYTEEGHREVGRQAAKTIDVLVTVGAKARLSADEAIKEGMSSDQVFSFSDNLSAGKFLQERIKRGDLILIKGSQKARMEKVAKELMAEPERAGELLVRQDKSWK